MKQPRLTLRPATVAKARALAGLENRPNEWAAKKRAARRERKAESRARFKHRQQFRAQLARMKRGKLSLGAMLAQMPRLPSLFDLPAPNYAAPTDRYWINADPGAPGGDVQIEQVQLAYPKLSLAKPLTEEQVARLRQMVEEQHERLRFSWLTELNPLKGGE
jgi:hypothetical protein